MSSGSEAVELAMKIARRWGYRVKGIAPNQAKILTISNNYHGKTLAPLSASSFKSFRNGTKIPQKDQHITFRER